MLPFAGITVKASSSIENLPGVSKRYSEMVNSSIPSFCSFTAIVFSPLNTPKSSGLSNRDPVGMVSFPILGKIVILLPVRTMLFVESSSFTTAAKNESPLTFSFSASETNICAFTITVSSSASAGVAVSICCGISTPSYISLKSSGVLKKVRIE